MDAKTIEEQTRRKYDGGVYSAKSISRPADKDPRMFADKLLALKFALVRKYMDKRPVLDLCCSNGVQLMDLAGEIAAGTGLDFSESFIAEAEAERQRRGIANIEFISGNARAMPLADGAFGTVYCFAALYHMPDVGEVIAEISRVLRPGGTAIFELGNVMSLNTIVCNSYPELAHPCHVPVSRMLEHIGRAGFRIVEHRRFQALPLWGARPWWMRPLLMPLWQWLMAVEIKGRMLDEWICKLPVVRRFAFRHMFVCVKAGDA